MTRNDYLYKILFAVELALLPMVLFAYLFIPQTWTIGLFIAGIAICKIWREVFRDKVSFTHTIINSIASAVVFTFLLIMLTAIGAINSVLAVFVLVFVLFAKTFDVLFFNVHMNDTVEAIDFCFSLFEIATLIGFTFVLNYSMIATVGLFALLLTGITSVAYKLYFTIRYTDFWNGIKNFFRKK